MKKLFILKGLICYFLCLSNSIYSQDMNEGIHFTTLDSWESILTKARKEGKYIFIDCNASWCMPCKKMESDVFSEPQVGQLFNNNFISVRLQFDSTERDNPEIRKNYPLARNLEMKWKIDSYPAYLFFDSNGELLQKGVGLMVADQFGHLASTALDPTKQFWKRVELFNAGKMSRNLNEMQELAEVAYSNKFGDLSKKVVSEYMKYFNKYLVKYERDLLTVKNIKFICKFLKSSSDSSFLFVYRNMFKVDSVLEWKGFSENLVYSIVQAEAEKNILKNKVLDSSDWKKLKENIATIYGDEWSDKIVLWSKINWFKRNKIWEGYSKLVIQKVERYGPYYTAYHAFDSAFYDSKESYFSRSWRLNDCAWEIFAHSNKQEFLEKALNWITIAIQDNRKPDGDFLDTYANLLYKLGKTEKAIGAEEEAIRLSPKNNDDMKTNLAKMKKGEPTWPVE